MALTGIQIYKLLPQTNCKDCGYPTCLAFAMKLAAKQAELAACPHVSEASKAQLESASAPPIRLVAVAGDGTKLEVGNEVVMFRHEKTFFRRPGLFIRVKDTLDADSIKAQVAEADAYVVDYVGIKLGVDGFAVEAAAGDAAKFSAAIAAVCSASKKPLVLIGSAEMLAAGVQAAPGAKPLLYAADADNWQKVAEVAKAAKAPVAVRAATLDDLAKLTENLKKAGVEDLVLDPQAKGYGGSLIVNTQLRRLALKQNNRALGYPIITFPGQSDGADETVLAAQHVAKYAGIIVLEKFDAAMLYPLLALRQNIYTDPQKPIQVLPGLYEVNSPKPNSPLMVTTNFSITYFAVNNEVEGSGWPAWLLVADAEGMSVLTAWAAGKFDADRIAKAVKVSNVESKLEHKKIIIPGQVAVLMGELEESLPGWQIMVGPKEAVDIPGFLKVMWK
jgi:acetyl-CoA decarbonylase/synthase complex subunit gamma